MDKQQNKYSHSVEFVLAFFKSQGPYFVCLH